MKLKYLLDVLLESQEIVITKPLENSLVDTRCRVSFFKLNLLEDHNKEVQVVYTSKVDSLIHILISSN